jgi:hypothetical protein
MEYVVGKHPCFPSVVPLSGLLGETPQGLGQNAENEAKAVCFRPFNEKAKNTYSFSDIVIGREGEELERFIGKK